MLRLRLPFGQSLKTFFFRKKVIFFVKRMIQKKNFEKLASDSGSSTPISPGQVPQNVIKNGLMNFLSSCFLIGLDKPTNKIQDFMKPITLSFRKGKKVPTKANLLIE